MASATTTSAGVERQCLHTSCSKLRNSAEKFVVAQDDELHHRLRLNGLLYGDCFMARFNSLDHVHRLCTFKPCKMD